MSDEDRAVIETMRTKKLKPGQALFLGPKSIAIITDKVRMEDSDGYVDMFVMEREEWQKL